MFFFFHYVSAKFHLWLSSCDLPRPRIGMLSLVTIFPVITAFHSCCLSHHVFFGTDPTLEEQTRIYKTKKSILVRPFGARVAADRGVESLRFLVSIVRRERFQILPKPARGLFVKKRGAIDNNYGRQKLLGIRLQDSAFLSEVAVNHPKKARGEIWPKRCERRNNTKTTKMRTKSPQ